MDRYEEVVTRFHPAISDLARKAYRETGRGFVVLTLSPDMPMLRWVALAGNVPKPPKKGKGIKVKTPKHIQMAYDYDPETSAVVAVAEATAQGDMMKEVMFMRLAPDSGGRNLAGTMQFEQDVNVTTDMHLAMGQDQSFISRHHAAIADFAKNGHAQKGAGAVVVTREKPSENHWLVGHIEGSLPSDEGSFMFYVPVQRLVEGPVKSRKELGQYDPANEANVLFLRPTGPAMTYTIGI